MPELPRQSSWDGLGRTQTLVLHLLADRPKNVRKLSNDWPGLTESMVTGALDRLARRGLVDRRAPHGFYEWHLTDKGAYVERELVRRWRRAWRTSTRRRRRMAELPRQSNGDDFPQGPAAAAAGSEMAGDAAVSQSQTGEGPHSSEQDRPGDPPSPGAGPDEWTKLADTLIHLTPADLERVARVVREEGRRRGWGTYWLDDLDA